jgi:hypothetical protein
MQHEHGQLDASVPGWPLVAVQQAAPPLVAVPPPQPPQQHHPFWGAAFDNEPRAARVAAILAALGIVFVPVVQGEAG